MTEAEGETTDVESVVTEKSNTESELSSNYGKLKHSDSLLLLTQVMQDPRLPLDGIMNWKLSKFASFEKFYSLFL